MKNLFCIIVAIFIFLPCFPAGASGTFSDVPESHYASEAITAMKNSGITTGYTDGSFKPENPVTRAEMAAFICRMKGIDAQPGDTSFDDVPKEHWASGYVAEAFRNNIISGNGYGNFCPDDNVTYEEAIKMSVLATDMGSSVKAYSSDWSGAYVEIADSLGISSKVKSTKGQNATRADVAIMLSNTLKVRENPNYILFSSHIYNTERNIPSDVSFALDSTVFLKDNETFDRELAKASAVLSMTAYDYISLDGKKGHNSDRVLKLMGFENIETTPAAKGNEADYHTFKIYTGNKKINSDGKSVSVIALCIAGTDGSYREWKSNFDIGDGKETGEYKKENHRSFDITARKICEKIKEYAGKYCADTSEKVVWITGHSRGASLADICASYLTAEKEKCFVYTFAPSPTTTDASKGKCPGVFDIVNTDDIITTVPPVQWGFGNYGKIARVSVYNSLLSQWQKATGLKTYQYGGNTEALAKEIAGLSPDRASCYAYTDINKVSYGAESEQYGEAYAKTLLQSFVPASLQHIKYEVTKSGGNAQYPYILTFHIQLAFYMHNLAAGITGKINPAVLMAMPLPESMTGAYSAIMRAYSSGIVHPHTPETYFVIAKNITGDDFR